MCPLTARGSGEVTTTSIAVLDIVVAVIVGAGGEVGAGMTIELEGVGNAIVAPNPRPIAALSWGRVIHVMLCCMSVLKNTSLIHPFQSYACRSALLV